MEVAKFGESFQFSKKQSKNWWKAQIKIQETFLKHHRG